jgi:hypothetical protein
MLSFRATTATLQITPVMEGLTGRANGIHTLNDRYIGVALLDRPWVPTKRMRSLYNVDVVALSLRKSPAKHATEGEHSNLEGVVEGEAPEWIGLLIASQVRPRREEGEQLERR